MALFGSKKNTEKTEKKAPVKAATKKAVANKGTIPSGVTFKNVLLRPRITEKAARQAEELNVYTFEVTPSATKREVAFAIREAYNFTPLRVSITNLPKKVKFIRGKLGTVGGAKKASVLLNKGDKIEFV